MFSGVATKEKSNKNTLNGSVDIWHRKLGHPSVNVLKHILKMSNVKTEINENLQFCDACQFGKSHSLPFKISMSRATTVLELIHTDLWGPTLIMSHTNAKYYIHFLDDYSRHLWFFPLKSKSDALAAFIQFKALVENHFNKKIKTRRSDMGGEFQAFIEILRDNGIEFQHPCPHTSAQNGRAERKHQHIVETGLTMLAQAHMPLKYWTDAFQTVTYLINRMPTPVLQGKSPYEVLNNKIPVYKELKVFGTTCFPCLRAYQPHKFSFRTIKCVNLGYSEVYKGYKCLSPH